MKRKIKNMVAFIVFIIIAAQIFTHTTYLFRNTDARGKYIQFTQEDRDSIDVVIVGSSLVHRYFDTMLAWGEYGYTSFDYSCAGMPAGLMISAINELYKSQHPKVVVINACTFLSSQWGRDINGAYRNFTDSIPFSTNRINAIYYFTKLNGIPFKDALSSYIDLIYYHDNTDSLKNQLNWELMDNKFEDEYIPLYEYKGYLPDNRVIPMLNYEFPDTKEEDDLLPEAEKCYRDLLQYSQTKGIPLLCITSPYLINEEEAKEINVLQRITGEYGLPFLNMNSKRVLNEMRVSLMKDYRDMYHMNAIGAQKYTEYVSNYLVANYDLTDHRNDDAYSSWNKLYSESYMPTITSYREQIKIKVDAYAQTVDKEKVLPKTRDCMKWLKMADDSNLTLLMCANQSFPPVSDEMELALNSFGMKTYLAEGNSYIGVYAGSVSYSDTEQEEYSGEIQEEYPGEIIMPYRISVKDGMLIQYGEKTYRPNDNKGVYILAVDSYSGEIVDAISIFASSDEDLLLRHQQK